MNSLMWPKICIFEQKKQDIWKDFVSEKNLGAQFFCEGDPTPHMGGSKLMFGTRKTKIIPKC